MKTFIKNLIRSCFEPRMKWDFGGIKRTRVSNTASFNHPERINLGKNVFIGHAAHLDGTGELVIQDNCQIGNAVQILTHSSHVAIRLYGEHYCDIDEDQKQGFWTQKLVIGKCTFVGPQAMILPGVTSIGIGCFIHPGAIVTKNLPDFTEFHRDGTMTDRLADDMKYMGLDNRFPQFYLQWVGDHHRAKEFEAAYRWALNAWQKGRGE